MSRRAGSLLALGVIAVVLPASASPQIHVTPGKWVGGGRITWVVKIKHTFRGKDPYGRPETLTETYREKAVYIVDAKVVGGLARAKMTGSGTGTDVYAGGPDTQVSCNTDPT